MQIALCSLHKLLFMLNFCLRSLVYCDVSVLQTEAFNYNLLAGGLIITCSEVDLLFPS